MSRARGSFFQAVSILKRSVSDALLVDLGPMEVDHNIRAKIFRSGLVVSAFSLLENYIEDRLEEVLVLLAGTGIPYQSFRAELREFLVLNAVHGLSNKLRFLDAADRLLFAEQNIRRLAQSLAQPASFTNLGFSPQGSNVRDRDIKDLTEVFGINGGWASIVNICRDVGFRRISLADDFRNFLRARNKAAHDVTVNIPSNDLGDYIEIALNIGIGADIAVSHAVSCYLVHSNINNALAAINTRIVNFRFISMRVDGSCSEINRDTRRTIRNHTNLDAAKISIQNRLRKTYNIVLDTRFSPIELF